MHLLALMLCLAVALPLGARGAEPGPASTDEIEWLVLTLQDDGARAKLVEDLRALIAVQRGTEKEKPAALSNPKGTQNEIRYTGFHQISHTGACGYGDSWNDDARPTKSRSRLCQWGLPGWVRRPPRGCRSSQAISTPLRS
jgi:hypothetical protein